MDVWAMKQATETVWTQSWNGEQIMGRPWEPEVVTRTLQVSHAASTCSVEKNSWAEGSVPTKPRLSPTSELTQGRWSPS